jgi:ABC-2 type transport system ATP-binding protein
MLSITNFQKKYPGSDEPVLSIGQLILEQGIYWIKGENGSGKTSLIKSIAGLIPFDGDIAVNDLNIGKQRMAYTKAVNYAEAEPQYPGFLTGTELVNFYHSAKGGNLPQQLISKLGADKFLNNKTAVYSSGMMKKLSLVLAFTGNPVLILLDEPFIALDVAAVEILQNNIAAFSKNGVSFIITSHQQLDHNLINTTASFIIKDKIIMQENK